MIQWLRTEKKTEVPANFSYRKLLKFCQANFYNIPTAGEKLFNHFAWLQSLPFEPRLSRDTLKLLQTGVMYIFGRDKYFRPNLIIDAVQMVNVKKKDANAITTETFTEMFIFLFQYIDNIMFLPGHVDMWVNVVNLGNMGMFEIPRDLIMAFGNVCQENLMYFMA